MMEKTIETGDERREYHGGLSIPRLCGQTVGLHRLLASKLAERGKPFERFALRLGHHETGQQDGVLFIAPSANATELRSLLGRGGQTDRERWREFGLATGRCSLRAIK